MPVANCGCSPEQADRMFKRSEQYVDQQIADLTQQQSRYWSDLYPVKAFPDGVGLVLDKVRFFGDPGPIYDGFDGWRKVQVSRSAAEGALLGEHDACGYNWEDVGHGIETVSYDLMERYIRTKPICIKDIRTFFQYQELQNLVFKNLANITMNMREQLNRNATMGFAVKYIALPNMPFNTVDPHQLPVIPSGVEVGKLNYRMLLMLYPQMAQEAGQYAIATLNGMPAFGVVASPETFDDMVRDDPDLREDLRYTSDGANSLIKRYNFLEGMGPFVFMPDLYAPRYNRDANGVLSRVMPTLRNIDIEIGTRAITNPAYHDAEFELVLVLTKDLFTLRSRKEISSVGGETNFDAETNMFQWKWHNPPRECDPYRHTGRYVTHGEFGIEPGDFTDVAAILVKRRPRNLSIQYHPAEECPPEAVECDNTLPLQGCPCPRVIGICAAVREDELTIQFDRATGAVASDTVELETPNGSYVSGTVQEANTATDKLRVRFASAMPAAPGQFVGIRCIDNTYCSANVVGVELCGIVSSQVTLILDRPIKAEASDVITLNLCSGDTLDVTIASADVPVMKYTVGMTYAQFCAAGGIESVCVPFETNEDCPYCGDSSLIECAYEIEGSLYVEGPRGGRLGISASPIAGVTLTATLDGDEVATAESAADGSYTIRGVQNGATVVVTPTLDGYTFTPASQTVTISDADETGVDFVGSGS